MTTPLPLVNQRVVYWLECSPRSR